MSVRLTVRLSVVIPDDRRYMTRVIELWIRRVAGWLPEFYIETKEEPIDG